jgi:predicted dehydrogenase
MTAQRARVALIGAGEMANRYHYPSLASFADVELVGISDLLEDKALATAARLHIPASRVFRDFRRMLCETEPEAVYVLMPPQHLYEPVHEVLTRGLHVFIEKPLALTPSQARMLAYTAAEHGCLTMVGFQRRFVPAVTALRQRLEERGPIQSADVAFLKSTPDLSQPAGFYNGAIDPLTSDGIHAVDNLRWLCGGEVEEVHAAVRTRYIPGPVPNAYSALVTFSNGSVGTVHYNLVTGRRIFRAEFHAQNVSVAVDADRQSSIVADNGELEVYQSTEFGRSALAAGEELQPQHWLGFWHENRHFIDSIHAGTQPSSCFADAVKSMELVALIHQATTS